MEQLRIERDAREKAEAEARAINEAARRKAEEEQEAAAELAEAQGATAEEVAAIVSAPLVVEVVAPVPAYVPQPRYVPPPSAPTVNVPKGGRETWNAELTDMRLLCAAIAEGKAAENLVQVNPVAARALAVMEKRVNLSVPGLRGVCTTGVPIRR